MNERNRNNQNFDNKRKSSLFIEVPAEQESPYKEKIPSALDPMGIIHIRGRAMRTLSGGRIPWWILLAAWISFAWLAAIAILITIESSFLDALPFVFFAAISFLIVRRGTIAKLSKSKKRKRI